MKLMLSNQERQRHWKKYKVYYFISIPIILAISTFSLKEFMIESEESYYEISSEFILADLNTELAGRVSHISVHRGAARITFENGEKVILGNAENYNYEIFLLACFIQVNDSIVKLKDSNEVKILRNEGQYHFILGESIDGKYKTWFYRNPCN